MIVDTLPEPLPEPVAKTIESSFKLVPKGTSLADYNKEYLAKHKQSPAHVRSALRVRQLLDPNTKSQNEKELQSTISNGNLSLEDVQDSLDLLGEWKSESNVKETLVEAAKKKWPQATILKKA